MAARALASATGNYEQAVAAKLRGALAEKRITKHQLAEMLGQTDFWVGRRANGQTPITVGELAAIAEALGEPIGRFLPYPEGRSAVGAAPGNFWAGARSSTDRASDYGSGLGHSWPFHAPGTGPRRERRRRHLNVVPLRLADSEAVG